MNILFSAFVICLFSQSLFSQSFKRSELSTSLSKPLELTFGPDNYLWVTEFGGKVYDAKTGKEAKLDKEGTIIGSGDWTVGFGHKLTKDEIKNKTYNNVVTESQGEQLLLKDAQSSIVRINKLANTGKIKSRREAESSDKTGTSRGNLGQYELSSPITYANYKNLKWYKLKRKITPTTYSEYEYLKYRHELD